MVALAGCTGRGDGRLFHLESFMAPSFENRSLLRFYLGWLSDPGRVQWLSNYSFNHLAGRDRGVRRIILFWQLLLCFGF